MTDSPSFAPPSPGFWELDRSHISGGATPVTQWLMSGSTDAAFRDLFRAIGIPADTLSMEFVNGFVYSRLRPLVSPDKPPRKAPPAVVLKALTRLHPEFRRRTRAARHMLEEDGWTPVIEEWRTEIRPRIEARNLELQEVELGSLGDAALADHLGVLLDHVMETAKEHFRLHGYDLGPIGLLVVAGRRWGIPASEMVDALAGASPSTAAPAAVMARIRAALDEAGVTPASLDDVTAVPAAAEELAAYLRLRGATLYSGYDIDTPTLAESPDVLLRTILAQGARPPGRPGPLAEDAVAGLRARVPAADRAEFDRLLADARSAMDMRDDNGPITYEWPLGLLRLAMLELGRRRAGGDALDEVEHVFELDRGELLVVARGAAGPSAAELAGRADARRERRALDPPLSLGEPEPEPPLDALPGPLATMIVVIDAVLSELGLTDHEEPSDAAEAPLTGVGVGQTPIKARARVAESAEEAFALLAPGEVLVTRTTSPAYNLVLTMVGGLVTAEGGPLCHAAVLSRELSIPAVIGVRGVLSAIADGDLVEVDPVEGSVRVLERSSAVGVV